jgi:hypothetical protein
LRAEHAGLPPLLIQAPADDLLAPDAEALATSASAGGVEVTYTRWPHMWHDFALQPGLLAAADSAVAQAAWFTGKVTASSLRPGRPRRVCRALVPVMRRRLLVPASQQRERSCTS